MTQTSTPDTPTTPKRTRAKAARAVARQRREALFADRAARDKRIDDGTARAIEGLARHEQLQATERDLVAAIGRDLAALAGEGLSRAELCSLTDLTETQVRRYLAAAETHSPATASTAGDGHDQPALDAATGGE